MPADTIFFLSSVLVLLSVALARTADRVGVPTLILFLFIGMLGGAEGLGQLQFVDAQLAQSVGVAALVIILFSGGMDTRASSVRPVLGKALSLATVGVLVTAVLMGLFLSWAFQLPFLPSLLIGAVISSTDAAAVFSVLRAKSVALKGQLKPLLELESGTNDPMAVFLTVALVQYLTAPVEGWSHHVAFFFIQMTVGGVGGYALGRLGVLLLTRLKLPYEGIYPVFLLAFAFFTYSLIALMNGSGFLAVYLAGLVIGNNNLVLRKSLSRFLDGMAWFAQIAMFLTLGLLVYPSHLLEVAPLGIEAALFLMFVARPGAVALALAPFRLSWREISFVSWVGLRGAVPIILATFPLLAGIARAELIFNVVFFAVVISAAIQGWSIPWAAKIFRVNAPQERKSIQPLEFEPPPHLSHTEMVEYFVPFGSPIVGRQIGELKLPEGSLITLICRNDDFMVPAGRTILEEGDVLSVLTDKAHAPEISRILAGLPPEPEGDSDGEA